MEKREWFILTHGFRGYRPWLLDLTCTGSVVIVNLDFHMAAFESSYKQIFGNICYRVSVLSSIFFCFSTKKFHTIYFGHILPVHPPTPSRSSPTPHSPNFMFSLPPDTHINKKKNQSKEQKPNKTKQEKQKKSTPSKRKRKEKKSKQHGVSFMLINYSCPKE